MLCVGCCHLPRVSAPVGLPSRNVCLDGDIADGAMVPRHGSVREGLTASPQWAAYDPQLFALNPTVLFVSRDTQMPRHHYRALPAVVQFRRPTKTAHAMSRGFHVSEGDSIGLDSHARVGEVEGQRN